MFKILILQRYYNLSDEQCEFQIKDRLSFMDFLGIKLNDTDARWTKKNQEVHFGYKNHVNVDKHSKLINKYCVSSASKHDSQLLKDLVDKDDVELYADSAYRSQNIEHYLQDIKCKSPIHEKAVRGNPLSDQQKANNHKKSKTKVRIEPIFGFMTNSMHDALHMRQIGKERIKSCIGLLNLTYNLFKYEQVIRLKEIKTPLALLGVDLKNIQFNKTCHFSNHPYLCKAL